VITEAAATTTSVVVAVAAAAAACMGEVMEFSALPMEEYRALAVVPSEPMLVRLAIEWVDPGVLAALWLLRSISMLVPPATLTAVETRAVNPSRRFASDVVAALVML